MGRLLKKDLLILRRSRLLVGVLVVYPVAIALLIGLAISRGPSKPKVAIVNESPPGQVIELGNAHLSIDQYYEELFNHVQPVAVATRAQALGKVQSGEVLAAVVIPANIAAQLSSVVSQAHVEVIYNGDAIEQSLAQSTIDSALAQANLALSDQIRLTAANGIDLLLTGGNFSEFGTPQNLLGLSQIPPILHGVISREHPGADRAQLQQVARFAGFAAQNLHLSKSLLSSVGEPVQVRSTLLHGRRTPLDAYAVVVAVSVSLMFVCVLLAAGGIALEREEHVLARLLRGLISREQLLAEKLLLAAGCSFVVALAMLAGIGAFVRLDWSGVGEWLLALAAGAVAFGALGVAIGVFAREVRAASLLAFLLSLPLAFLALVPRGSVAAGLYDAIRGVSLLFPYKATLQALDTAVNGASPGIWISLAHLLALTAAFGALARVGLRRT